MTTNSQYTAAQVTIMAILRIFIGWHLLYEGMVKLITPNWSSISYLNDSQGIFAPLFKFLASNDSLVQLIDFVNIWLLIIIGLCLMLGLLSRIMSMAGAILLVLYYICQPPFTGLEYVIPSEGNYLIINKTLIEIAALLVLFYFPAGRTIGLDYYFTGKKSNE